MRAKAIQYMVKGFLQSLRLKKCAYKQVLDMNYKGFCELRKIRNFVDI